MKFVKIESLSEFKALKMGDWLETPDGLFEVTSEYDEFHNTIGTAEVYFDNDDCDEYHLENESPYTTFSDIKGSEMYGCDSLEMQLRVDRLNVDEIDVLDIYD